MMQKTRTAPVIANDGKGNRRVSLSMTAQQRAKINQENVNRITHRLEEIHDEMHELDDIIFFVEHSELVKVIMRVMMGRVKILLAKAWSQWAGDCNTMVGFADPREIKKLEPLVVEAKKRMEVAEQELEEKMRNFVNMRLRTVDDKKRAFLIGIFGKGGAEGKRAVFMEWKIKAAEATKIYKTCKRFFKRILNLKVSMAIRKWQSEVYSANMPPEEQIKHLQFAVEQARKDMKINEKLYEDIVMAQTAAAFDALSDDKKMLLKRILGQMLTHMKRVVLKEWKYKVDNYDRQRALMTGFINRMMKSYLQKGWVTWEYYDKGAVAFKAKRRTIYLQKSITTLGDQVSRLDDILKAQLEEVEVMRQCVETQIKCSERVCAGREAVADALPEAIDLCEEDLEPQIEALAAEVEMSCDIRDLIEEGG
jgi:hypothetical protein